MLNEPLGNRAYNIFPTSPPGFLIHSSAHNLSSPILFINGSSSTVVTSTQDLLGSDAALTRYRSLRVVVTGVVAKESNRCCIINTYLWGSMILIPLFCLCCDWWKRKAYRILSINIEAYKAMADLIRTGIFKEFYLTIQDNNFNRYKAQTLLQAIQYGGIKNVRIVNDVQGFDTEGDNYSSFNQYMAPLLGFCDFAQAKWANKAITNLIIGRQ